MKRYLDENNCRRFIEDFQFLFKLIRDSHGELDLRLRNNYFNIYYRGNSILKIDFRKTGYQVTINQKFVDGVFERDSRFSEVLSAAKKQKEKIVYNINPDNLHSFLQRKNLDKLSSNVKKVNYGEEIVFEQALITDNMNREYYLIIDRQVTETELRRQRIDLLGLRQLKGNIYAFEVVEIKMGNSNDLKRDVGLQLERYVSHIRTNIVRWKDNYEQVYRQLKQAKLFDKPTADEIDIRPEVSGRLVVIGYSGIGRLGIAALKQSFPDLVVEQKDYLL